jgi:hypothetical protein
VVDTKTFPVDGIKHLIIEQATSGAKVRGEPEDAVVQVTYQAEDRAGMPEFSVEGETLAFRGGAAVRVTLPPYLALTIYEAAGELRVQDLSGGLTVEIVHGDLRLKGLTGSAHIGQIDGDLRAEDVLELRVAGGCGGDLRAQGGGNLSIESVGGDARLFALRSARLAQVVGDFWAESVTGTLEIVRAAGDVKLIEIGGFVALQQCSGDLQVVDLGGGMTAQSVQGDANLRGSFGGTEEYNLAAAGDITLTLTLAADLRLAAQAGGRMRSNIQLTPAPDGSPSFTATLGRGIGHVCLQSGGDLQIAQAERAKDLRPDSVAGSGGARTEELPTTGNLDMLSDHIRRQASASLSAAGLDVAGRRFPFDAGMITSVGTRPDRSAAEAGHYRPVQFELPRLPVPGGPSAEEELAILRMVEAGTITVEQADNLFRALGAE